MLDRILALLKENGITAKKLTSDLEISNSSVSDWKKGSKPSCDVVVKLAKYFGVSEHTVRNALRFVTEGEQPEAIRNEALKNYGCALVKKHLTIKE